MMRRGAFFLIGIACAIQVNAVGWFEPLRLKLGPDSNACGIILPKPLKSRPVIMWLHGGMRSQNTVKGWEAWRALLPFLKPGAYFLCSPSAYMGADWLSPEGLAHMDTLLSYLARNYPARLDDLILIGVSDGCLGVLRYAREGMRKPKRFVMFSSYPPLAVNPDDLLKDPVYAFTRWDVFQGGRDRLFPTDQVFPLLQAWAKANTKVRLHLYPEGEHDFSWYAEHAEPEIKKLF